MALTIRQELGPEALGTGFHASSPPPVTVRPPPAAPEGTSSVGDSQVSHTPNGQHSGEGRGARTVAQDCPCSLSGTSPLSPRPCALNVLGEADTSQPRHCTPRLVGLRTEQRWQGRLPGLLDPQRGGGAMSKTRGSWRHFGEQPLPTWVAPDTLSSDGHRWPGQDNMDKVKVAKNHTHKCVLRCHCVGTPPTGELTAKSRKMTFKNYAFFQKLLLCTKWPISLCRLVVTTFNLFL